MWQCFYSKFKLWRSSKNSSRRKPYTYYWHKTYANVKALLNVRDSVVDRNHVKLMYEAKPVTRAHTSLDTTIYIFERKYTNAWQGLSTLSLMEHNRILIWEKTYKCIECDQLYKKCTTLWSRPNSYKIGIIQICQDRK